MRLASWLNRNLFLGFAAGLLVGVPASWLTLPVYKWTVRLVYEEKFAVLTFQCDQAMREHWISKMALAETPSEFAIADTKSSEIALLVCQDYDLLQKRLIALGLDENEIGIMVLNAAELDPGGLKTIEGIHEIRH